jgi:hypothetical protein
MFGLIASMCQCLFYIFSVDANRRGWRGTPSKDFEKFGHKNAIKHENRGPLHPQIFSQPHVPPKKNLTMTVHL